MYQIVLNDIRQNFDIYKPYDSFLWSWVMFLKEN